MTQRAIKIGPEILDGLDPHAEPQERLRQVLLARNAGTSFDRGLHCPETGRVLNEPQSGAHRVGGEGVATHIEGDDRAEALELAPCRLVRRMARVADCTTTSAPSVNGR